MLKYSTVRIVYLVLSIVALLFYYFFHFHWAYLLVLPLSYFALIAYGSSTIQANFFLQSVCKSPTSEKIIALSFDDGPDPIRTPKILALLKQHGIPASFFVIGKKISSNEPLLQQIHQEGHLIGNHSYEHSYVYDFYSTAKVAEDLKQTNQLIKSIVGKEPRWFRPPYGVTNPNIAKAISLLQLTSIGWNVRSLDTIIQNPDTLYKRITRQIQPGSIVLFHDTGKSTLETLQALVHYVKENGYTIVPLTQLINDEAYTS